MKTVPNSELRVPSGELPAGCQLQVVLPETKVLEAAAAQNAEMAAEFIRQGNRRAGREHLQRAIEQINEAELE